MSLQNAEHVPAEACSDEVYSEECATPFTYGGPMPKAKPVSLHPLSFDEAIKTLISVSPKKQKRVVQDKRKPIKR